MKAKGNKNLDNSDWLNQIKKIREYSSKQFDKLVIYLSSGALILSLGFTKDIVQITESTNKSMLIFSWSSFVLALLLMLFSHKSSIYSMDYELNNKFEKSNLFDKVTEILNWGSTISLITGIIIFIIFICKNF